MVTQPPLSPEAYLFTGREISAYLEVARREISAAYGGWPISIRTAGDPTNVDVPWVAELGFLGMERAESDGVGTKARCRFGMRIHYSAVHTDHKEPYHLLDMAASVASYLVDLRTFAHPYGELLEEVSADLIVEAVQSAGVRVASGHYVSQVSWVDTLVLRPQITVPGYTTTSPDPDEPADIIEGFTLRMVDVDGNILMQDSEDYSE